MRRWAPRTITVLADYRGRKMPAGTPALPKAPKKLSESIVRGKVPCPIIAEVADSFLEIKLIQILHPPGRIQDDSEEIFLKWSKERMMLNRLAKKRVQAFACTLEREAATRSLASGAALRRDRGGRAA